MHQKTKQATTRVFTNHSHADREVATDLQSILLKFGTETHLHQDGIRADDALTLESPSVSGGATPSC